LGDGNSKQWKLYNLLNIVNVFKKNMIDFSIEKPKNFPFNPISEEMLSIQPMNETFTVEAIFQ
jgi:hypothetical protein